jgi:hypothetical protein
MYRPVMWNAILRVGLLTVPILVPAVLFVACGGQDPQESVKGDASDVNGQIAFRRWFDPDHTEGALFMMNTGGSHVRQIMRP